MTSDPTARWRLASLDQYRGYTVAGMFVVNFLGSFAITPPLLKHHNTYCSYADTIMPQFLFAVGFAFRLTFVRHAQAQGLAAAYRRVARRLGGLIALGLVIYTLGAIERVWSYLTEGDFLSMLAELFKRHWFQTLLHIAVTSLWILPVIRAGAAVRIVYMIVSAAAHVALSSWFNFAWLNSPPHGIDGGPLGFLTWTIPVLVGTLACDVVMRAAPACRPGPMLAWAIILMTLGYGLSCGTRLYDVPGQEQSLLPSPLAEPPFVPPPGPAERQWNYWMMSQRSGSVSYLTFAAGFSLAVFVLFYVACDRLGWRVGLFRTLGTNALAAYILGGAAEVAIKPFIARDAPWWEVAAGFAVFFGGTWLAIRLLEKKGLMLRL
jgi:predicted acyltransferase